MPEHDRSAAFLDAFVRIEKRLRDQLARGTTEGFRGLVARGAEKSPLIRRVAPDLYEYAELRNALVHDRRGGRPIAEPHEETVADLERIAGLLEDPATVARLSRPQVQSCSPDDRIGAATGVMLAGGFSQLPVYAGRRFVGLLTSETVARWVAHRLAGTARSVDDPPVADVLTYREDGSVEEFAPRDELVLDVIERFERAARRGHALDAVIVTASGGRDEKPIAIFTTFDLPQLYQVGLGRAP